MAICQILTSFTSTIDSRVFRIIPNVSKQKTRAMYKYVIIVNYVNQVPDGHIRLNSYVYRCALEYKER